MTEPNKNRNFGGTGKPFSRRPPVKIHRESYFGEKLKPEEVEEYLTGKKIRCLICGDYFQAVGNHSFVVHGVTAKEYKLEFGIPVKRGLIGSDLKDLKHDLCSIPKKTMRQR